MQVSFMLVEEGLGIWKPSRMLGTKVFLSYSKDSEEHQEWVARLADALERESDIDVVFDEYDLYAGKDLTKFMERAAEADRVVVVLTPEYARRANERLGGVGYESNILTARLFQDSLEDISIPVLRGNPEKSIPSYMRSKVYIDMREKPPGEVYELLRSIRQLPKRVRPRKEDQLLPPVENIVAWLNQFSDIAKITEVVCEPLAIGRGESVSLRYTIVSNKGEPLKIWLGASVLPSASGDEYYSVEQDKVVMLQPGEGTYSRELTIPQEAPTGLYRVVCAAYLEQLHDMRLDRIDLGCILTVI